MGRRGKIARLPREIREQVNHKLDNGLPGNTILAWLNALPDTRALLAAEFDGRRISKQNLSEWRAGGYREWQIGREALEAMRSLVGDERLMEKTAGVPLTDMLAIWVTARYSVEAGKLQNGDRDDKARWKLLRIFLKDVSVMRRGDHDAQRLKLKREWLEFAQQMQQLKRQDGEESTGASEPENQEGASLDSPPSCMTQSKPVQVSPVIF